MTLSLTSADATAIETAVAEVKKVIVGQQHEVDCLMISLLAEGNVLVEGLPGLAKTVAAETLSKVVGVKFGRVQFTPDLLPSDLTGTRIYKASTDSFDIELGPIFVNMLLADEINRAPAKVQSALLEVMAEKKVTIGDKTFHTPRPFIVAATQNPIESEGVFTLPRALRDRFMMKVEIEMPEKEDELEIVQRMSVKPPVPEVKMDLETLQRLQRLCKEAIYVDKLVLTYAVDLVMATRYPAKYGAEEISELITVGGSPRASLSLVNAAKGMALLKGRPYVLPEDVLSIAPDVLRHRLMLSYEAMAEGVNADQFIQRLLQLVPAPRVTTTQSSTTPLMPQLGG